MLTKKYVGNIFKPFNFFRMDSYEQFDCHFNDFCDKFVNEDELVFIQILPPGFQSISSSCV